MSRSKVLVFISAITITLLIGASSFLPAKIYSSAGWLILWILIGIAVIFGLIKKRLWRNIPLLLIHLSLLCMIIGGICTALFSQRGTLHLMPSATVDSFISEDGKLEKLPAPVTLISFSPEYYPGMNFPRDFKSEVLVATSDTMHISMNHIGRYKNFRFYQNSYDNEGGSILAVASDPIGITIVYAGFLLFSIGGIAYLMRNFIYRKRKSTTSFVILSCILSGALNASATPAVSNMEADSLACRQVLFNGNAVPFNTVATKMTYKLTGQDHVGKLSPDAFIASLIKYKEEWSTTPFIKIKNRQLRNALKIEGDYAALSNFYDENGNYIPAKIYKGGTGKLDKDIIMLDEKIALLIDLWDGELFTPLDTSSPEIRSDFSIKTEVAYNRIQPVRILFICSIITAIAIFFMLFLKRNFCIWRVILALGIAGVIVYLWLWYVSPAIPLANTSDMMLFLGISVLLLTAYVSYRKESQILVVLAMLSASFLILVAWLGMKDPVMTPVMPVLASPWLSIHVSLMMVSYAVLGFTLPVALIALIRPDERERLTSFALTLIKPGTYLLGLGIITGAMWANVSWGRYWAWDPKETWALVTMLLYSIPLHSYFKMRRHSLTCDIYLILIFFSIIMTYFGVNYLPSLHAYN